MYITIVCNIMNKYKQKEKLDASLTGPRTISPAVNSLREELLPFANKVHYNDQPSSKPSGRLGCDALSLKTRGKRLRIATWNVRTLYKAGKLDNLIQEANRMKLDIIGIAETRWTDNACVKRDDYTFIYSGREKHQHGVGMLIKKNLETHSRFNTGH